MDEIIIASLKIEFRVYGYEKEFPTPRNYIMLYRYIKRKTVRALLSHFHHRLCVCVSI